MRCMSNPELLGLADGANARSQPSCNDVRLPQGGSHLGSPAAPAATRCAPKYQA